MNISQKKGLSFTLKYFYGVGDAMFNMMTNVETFFFMSFLTNTAMFGPVVAGIIGSVTSIVDMCLSWVYGGILNGTKAKKYGRYRSWLVLTTWIVPFIYAIQFMRIGTGETIAAIIICAAFIISHFIWNFSYVANATLISVVGKTPGDRAILSSSRGTWNSIGSMASSYMGLPMALLLGGIVGGAYQWAALAFVAGVLMCIAYYAHFKMTEGYEEIETEDSGAPNYNKIKVGEMFAALFKTPPLMILMVVDIARWVVKFVSGAAAIYYFRDAMQNTALQAPYTLAIAIAAMVGAFVVRFVARKFTNRMSLVISTVGMAVCMFLGYLLYANAIVVIVCITLANFFYGMAYSAIPALYADTVVYSTWKSGKNASGWIMGLMNLPLKIGVFLRAPVLTAALVAAGWEAGKVFEGTARQSMTVAFALVPGIFCAVAVVIFVIGYRLSEAKVKEYQSEIDKRQA